MNKRIIKFRVWDGNEMTYPNIIAFQENFSWNHWTSALHDSTQWCGEKGYVYKPELMQFTGFTDKNGKEVYEGDIVVAWSAGSKATFEIKWRQEASPCYILFPAWQNREMWHISATKFEKGKQFIDVEGNITTSDIDGYIDDGIEIIGNIYENPELIIQKQTDAK